MEIALVSILVGICCENWIVQWLHVERL